MSPAKSPCSLTLSSSWLTPATFISPLNVCFLSCYPLCCFSVCPALPNSGHSHIPRLFLTRVLDLTCAFADWIPSHSLCPSSVSLSRPALDLISSSLDLGVLLSLPDTDTLSSQLLKATDRGGSLTLNIPSPLFYNNEPLRVQHQIKTTFSSFLEDDHGCLPKFWRLGCEWE